MRTYGRTYDDAGVPHWVVVTTDDAGYNDNVYLTTLIQNLKLNLGESPFYGDRGIPAKQAVVQQIFPDFYVSLTQQRFAPNFAALIVAKQPLATPTYNISATTQQGSKLSATVAT